RWSAAVPEESATACEEPTVLANSFWNASTWGPNGAIQLEAKTSAMRLCSMGPMCGGERKIRPLLDLVVIQMCELHARPASKRFCRYASHSGMVRHIPRHHRTRPDHGITTHTDTRQQRGARAD